MRFICRPVARTVGLATLALGVFLLGCPPAPARAENAEAPGQEETIAGDPGTGVTLHAPHRRPSRPFRLDEADEIAALEAVRIALSEVADGGSYVWYRDNGHLNGLVNPTSSFKDAHGRVCRHLVLILSAGLQTGRIEGIACRDAEGRWLLEG